MTWLVALSPQLILFGNQVKPYIFDALASTALLWAALPFLHSGRVSPWASARVGLAVGLGMLISYPCAFVVGGLACAIALQGSRALALCVLAGGPEVSRTSLYLGSQPRGSGRWAPCFFVVVGCCCRCSHVELGAWCASAVWCSLRF